MKLSFLLTALLFCLLASGTQAQVSIVNIPIQPFNLTPEALLNVNILNTEAEKQVQILTQLFNSNNMMLLSVRSQPFTLSRGLNSGSMGNRKIASVEFAGSTQASYLKSTHNLASGRYKVCSTLLIGGGADKVDDFCEELEADFNQYLYLVNPMDGDTVEIKYPILSWTHSEPFSILNQGETYRMIVSEIKKGQSPEEAITVNSPAMIKTALREHELQYPYDARELRPGAKYAWQVQKLSDGVVINKTEAWSFNVRQPHDSKKMKYVALKHELDGSFFNAADGLVYFKFSEEYKTRGDLRYQLLNDKKQPVDIDIKTDDEAKRGEKTAEKDAALKVTGNNLYALDLNGKKLKTGFYTLEIKNEKNESFYLKIFLP